MAPAVFGSPALFAAEASGESVWPHVVLALFLLILAAALLAFQWRTWKSLERQSLDESDVDYLRRQFRRRVQVNLMIGLAGLALLGGVWVTDPIMMVVYWGAVVLLTVWIGLLAAADIVSTRGYLRRAHERHAAEIRAITNQLRRLRRARDNGDPPRGDEAADNSPDAVT